MVKHWASGLSAGLILGVSTWMAPAQAEVDLDVVNEIRHEGLHHSQVMDTLDYLTDVIGPRLTGSPGMNKANEWTREQLESWGLENARLHGFDFGQGWSFDHSHAWLASPRKAPLIIYPRAWTPGTDGPVQGPAKRVKLEDESDLEKYAGKLEGKILLLDEPREIEKQERSPFHRHDDDSLENMERFPIPGEAGPDWRQRRVQMHHFREKRNAFLAEEGVLATVHISSRDYGIVRTGAGAAHDADAEAGVPAVQMASEHYNLLARLLQRDKAVEIGLDVKARFHDDDLQAYNTLAEIPGRGRNPEIVMAGAHLDSWHPGTGATDNAAGVAVVMEAVRILQAIGVQPRRTIRVGLWSGEEQGLLGSRAYVDDYIATRPEHEDEEQLALPARLRDATWPIEPLRGHDRHVAYFNFDNGSGRIRGIHAQENVAAMPIFENWLEPFHDLGATTVSSRNTGSTDHVAFDAVGIPGFQFIQDRLDYFAHTHHSHLDTRDHVERDDLIQSAVVLASFLYHAAMRDESLPRKPMPREPED
ncbi:M20/M25/M40 family metallo-hydrolase [Gammaproteobacteria bacterium AB-CW1]|uniref:Carboxypeptidase Q n=1 Tax=Natronospira elongata TaxID=3110268 RepID=A0AAP6JEI9_9GAMM|nr:M20/M25/M40 family metallo-hydrolase [Gammaproteobacteria bacterium AB-CW1]